MYDYFFAHQLHEAAWNVTAASCSLFSGAIDVRAELLNMTRKSGIGHETNLPSHATHVR
jgi:hypothetical protein